MDYEEYDRVWRGSTIGSYKYASQGDESVFTGDHSYSDAASRSAESVPRVARRQNREDPPIQASSSPCPSAVGALNDSSLNLCHRCSGISAESLSGELGFEHGLLSELPSHDQLDQLKDWPNSGSSRFCKLCGVFMESLHDDEIGMFVQDRLRLILHLEELERERCKNRTISVPPMCCPTRRRRWRKRCSGLTINRNAEVLRKLLCVTRRYRQLSHFLFSLRNEHCFTAWAAPEWQCISAHARQPLLFSSTLFV